MQQASFEEKLEPILRQDPRYHLDGYLFVREALDHTQQRFNRSNPEPDPAQHITGQQLLQGLREYALQQFGPMALTVLEEWGIRRGEDVGEIVWNMIEGGLLTKTESDRKEDFRGGYDFKEAFSAPYKPAPERSLLASKSKPTQV